MVLILSDLLIVKCVHTVLHTLFAPFSIHNLFVKIHCKYFSKSQKHSKLQFENRLKYLAGSSYSDKNRVNFDPKFYF